MAVERPPRPPFTREAAAHTVQAAEDAANACDPERVAGAYTVDSVWRNRDQFVTGRDLWVPYGAALGFVLHFLNRVRMFDSCRGH